VSLFKPTIAVGGSPSGQSRSAQWFSLSLDVCQGVNVRHLRQDADRVYVTLQTILPADMASFDPAGSNLFHLLADKPPVPFNSPACGLTYARHIST